MAYRLPPARFVARLLKRRPATSVSSMQPRNCTSIPAAISQQIKGLEDYLGVRLFVRLTRALAITPQGEAMLPKIRAGFDCLAEAVGSTCSAEAGGLNVMAPPSFATRWLVPHLPDFAAAHPDIRLRLSSSSDSGGPAGQRAACGWRCTRSPGG